MNEAQSRLVERTLLVVGILLLGVPLACVVMGGTDGGLLLVAFCRGARGRLAALIVAGVGPGDIAARRRPGPRWRAALLGEVRPL